jgi:hypothetical protein
MCNLASVLRIVAATTIAVLLVGGTWASDEFSRRSSMPLAAGRNSPNQSSKAVTQSAGVCEDVKPFTAYRFIEGVDKCAEMLTPAGLAQLQDPFAVNVLQKGIGEPNLWPSTVEQIVNLVSAAPGFAANQKSYLIGEGGQITNEIAPRDASRNLRYVVTWGQTSSPSVFLSAAPTATHPGRPAPFLQVIGYDQNKNVFNYYQYAGDKLRTWQWTGDSTWSRITQSAGQGCFACHINGALNMKELVTPWNNWGSPRATISAGNIPDAVAQDPLYAALSGADVLQGNFQGLQARYTQHLVGSSIKNGVVSDVAALLNRLINTTTINFQASFSKPSDSTDIQVPPDFFMFHSALTMPQINLSFATPALKINRSTHDGFVSQHQFALQQLSGDDPPNLIYQRLGTNFFAFFVPAPAFEDMVAIREMINQNVIDPNFAASVLLVDFANPIFSSQRSSLMKYAGQISTAQVLVSGQPNPSGVPAQFIALVRAAAASQPACDTSSLASCTPEQQFLHFAGQGDWQERARGQINPYLAFVGERIATAAGADDYLTMSVSRQSQFAGAPGVGNLDEFSLLLPCNDVAVNKCKRMNVDGTIGDDPQWSSACSANRCVSPK